MTSRLNPYLNFSTEAREAMGFYKSVLGGELTIMSFAQGGMPHAPADADLVMHAQLETPLGFTLMASDMPREMGKPSPNGTVSLSGDDAAELRSYWTALSADGEVVMPLESAPWGDAFGMLTDRFGVQWMVNIAGRT